MIPNATRFSPTVKTELAIPSSGPAVPAASATCCSVRPSVAGKSAGGHGLRRAHLRAHAALGGDLRRRILGV